MLKEKNKIKILLSGGGTAGSVIPLLAIAREFKKDFPETDFLWLGGKIGPEKELVAAADLKFRSISAGKFRRYFSLRNVLDIFFAAAGFFESLEIINKWRPDIILSAGSFISVPVVFAGRVLGVPSLIHQEDIRPGLANKLMAPAAQKITVTFKESLKYFNSQKTIWTGNPAREEILSGDKEAAFKFFGLDKNLPVVLVFGGGTGALAINDLVKKSLPELSGSAQIIHLTGRGKGMNIKQKNYHSLEFVTKEMPDLLAAANLVVSRAGLSSLTELAILGKSTIIIPLPGHQEDNASVFREKDAAVILDQKKLTPEKFAEEIKNLLNNGKRMAEFGGNIKKILKRDAAAFIVKEILEII